MMLGKFIELSLSMDRKAKVSKAATELQTGSKALTIGHTSVSRLLQSVKLMSKSSGALTVKSIMIYFSSKISVGLNGLYNICV